jgi:hypothetical protein
MAADKSFFGKQQRLRSANMNDDRARQYSISRHALFSILGLVAGFGTALAQMPLPPTSSPAAVPAAATPLGSPVTMEEPTPGDHWTYELRDEVLGTARSQRTIVVTEVTATEIGARIMFAGNPGVNGAVFDRSWNTISSGGWRYAPNDGWGVQLPLAVGKKWNVKSNDVNSANGANWTRSGSAKVVAQESVTTRAGTFDTFKIETIYSARNVKDPTSTVQVTIQTWWAPSIDHWVKRTFANRSAGHLVESTTDTLVSYGRRQ